MSAPISERCRRLYSKGVKVSEIAKRVRVSETMVYNHLDLQAYSVGRGPLLNKKAWLDWLGGMTTHVRSNHTTRAQMTVQINGFALNDADSRVFSYWRGGDTRDVNLTRADKFCLAVDIQLQHFILWCHLQGTSPWKEGCPEWESPVDDVAERVCEVLKRYLRLGASFDNAWRVAMSTVKPHESWETVLDDAEPDELPPLTFAREAFREEYEDAQERRKERSQAA